MSENAAETIATGFLDDLLQHDWESAMAQLADDAQIIVTGRNALAGSFTSPAHFLQTLNWIFREHDAGIDLMRCDELIAGDGLAVAFVEERAHRDIRSLRYRRVLVMTIEDGVIVELRVLAEDPYALDQFWA